MLKINFNGNGFIAISAIDFYKNTSKVDKTLCKGIRNAAAKYKTARAAMKEQTF